MGTEDMFGFLTSDPSKAASIASSARKRKSKVTDLRDVSAKTKKPKKKLVKKKPVTTKYPLERFQKALSSGKNFVGIDMSLGSPGLAILNTRTRTASMYFLTPKRKSFTTKSTDSVASGPMQGWTVTTTCLDRPSIGETDNFKDRCKRYHDLVQLWIAPILELDPAETQVGLEHYAYSATQTSAYTKLMEMGGYLRVSLYAAGFDVHEFSPSYMKKCFTGNGKASKAEICDRLVDDFGMDLFEWTGIHIRGNKSLNPIDDMADAFSAAFATTIQTKW